MAYSDVPWHTVIEMTGAVVVNCTTFWGSGKSSSSNALKNQDIPVVLLASRNSKFRPHYVLHSGLINLNPNFGVNRSIWGIWGFIRIIKAWGLIRSFRV